MEWCRIACLQEIIKERATDWESQSEKDFEICFAACFLLQHEFYGGRVVGFKLCNYFLGKRFIAWTKFCFKFYSIISFLQKYSLK